VSFAVKEFRGFFFFFGGSETEKFVAISAKPYTKTTTALDRFRHGMGSAYWWEDR
jgi:hypothetical protein